MHNCFQAADILIPGKISMTKWACVACDQYSSQPEYWENAKKIVGDAPSALRLMLPEAYLNSAEVNRRIALLWTATWRMACSGHSRTA